MTYQDKLNEVLLAQSQNELFYIGDISGGAQVLVKQIIDAMDCDMASVWLYNNERDSIVLQQLYSKAENKFSQGSSLLRKEFPQYFDALDDDQVIVAEDAETHPATSCFLEKYLHPFGIKSMLDVPIWYRGRSIGVICVENLTPRLWKKEEIDFTRIISSFYSFAFSMKETRDLADRMISTENFIDKATLVSITDSKGRITYVNEKFTKVSGYELEEVLGKDHSILNSGEQPDGYWGKMYETVLGGGIWNDVVTNRNKNGNLYYVDTYIRAIFDSSGNLEGFSSVRQDVTGIIKASKEIEKKNTYLEHAAKILRHDMHSGINTYIPRGISSLERRMGEEKAKELKIEAPIKMIKEGLRHTQKVYRGVYEFTNLVKKDVVLNKSECDLRSILEDYLNSTAYRANVEISDLGKCNVNEALFCTAIDNLIRNGLRYNDSSSKLVKIYRVNDRLFIEDNGRGLSSSDFKHLSQPYVRKEGQKESGSGLGLNICIAILEEHGFSISCDKLPQGGTKIEIILSTCGL